MAAVINEEISCIAWARLGAGGSRQVLGVF